MKSTENMDSYLTILKELNMNNRLELLDIQLLRSWDKTSTYSVDYIYGYSYSILSELWVVFYAFNSTLQH
jgi:hypothetical protein